MISKALSAATPPKSGHPGIAPEAPLCAQTAVPSLVPSLSLAASASPSPAASDTAFAPAPVADPSPLDSLFAPEGPLGRLGMSRGEGELFEHYIVRAATALAKLHALDIEYSLRRVFAEPQMRQVIAYFEENDAAMGDLGAIETLSFGLLSGAGGSRNGNAQSLKEIIRRHRLAGTDTGERDEELARAIGEMERDFAFDVRVTADLATLWENKLCGVKIDGGDFTTFVPDDDPYLELGRRLVLEPEVEAYAGGVPLEDILA